MPHGFFLQSFFAQLSIYRDDLNHPLVSGNKLHKLAPNLKLAKQSGCSTVLSFGGPYSNHLHALAWAGREQGLECIGVIRGELHAELTPTLNDCQHWGMRLIPMSREIYRSLLTELQITQQASIGAAMLADCLPSLIKNVPANTLVIPEGGSNLIAIDSLTEAYRPIFAKSEYQSITHAVCATGTGATVAGLFKAAPKDVKVIGVQAVAEGDANSRSD